MVNIELQPVYLEHHFEQNGITLDVIRQDIMAMAVARGITSAEKNKVEKYLASQLNLTVPKDPLSFSSDEAKKMHLIPVAVGQYFILASPIDKWQEKLLASLPASLYPTDQSDAWVVVRLVGENVADVLARTISVNMSADVFKVSNFARTGMEYMASIILRISEDEYWLLSASSSALSFIHAIEQSISNIDV